MQAAARSLLVLAVVELMRPDDPSPGDCETDG
jgi:hypothetical protein